MGFPAYSLLVATMVRERIRMTTLFPDVPTPGVSLAFFRAME
jgi:hypothetical protein